MSMQVGEGCLERRILSRWQMVDEGQCSGCRVSKRGGGVLARGFPPLPPFPFISDTYLANLCSLYYQTFTKRELGGVHLHPQSMWLFRISDIKTEHTVQFIFRRANKYTEFQVLYSAVHPSFFSPFHPQSGPLSSPFNHSSQKLPDCL